MSECVVRMPYPKDCESCHLKTRNYFNGEFICAKTHTFLPASGKNNNCPIICSLPEGHGRLVDADAMAKDLKYDCELDARGLDDMTIVGHEREHLQFDKDCKQNCMWYLTEQETIVPADTAERSET